MYRTASSCNTCYIYEISHINDIHVCHYSNMYKIVASGCVHGDSIRRTDHSFIYEILASARAVCIDGNGLGFGPLYEVWACVVCLPRRTSYNEAIPMNFMENTERQCMQREIPRMWSANWVRARETFYLLENQIGMSDELHRPLYRSMLLFLFNFHICVSVSVRAVWTIAFNACTYSGRVGINAPSTYIMYRPHQKYIKKFNTKSYTCIFYRNIIIEQSVASPFASECTIFIDLCPMVLYYYILCLWLAANKRKSVHLYNTSLAKCNEPFKQNHGTVLQPSKNKFILMCKNLSVKDSTLFPDVHEVKVSLDIYWRYYVSLIA